MRMISRASFKETLADSQMLPGCHGRGRKSSRRVTDVKWAAVPDAAASMTHTVLDSVGNRILNVPQRGIQSESCGFCPLNPGREKPQLLFFMI